ncbi:rhodanese-like domain-containing protein [Listeria rustica]|uniref:Rhodanese-like domain-containing protein n=1 Tax=Listeria rustica TaxID=2713503 RepID=A0A7W1YFS9_9LIST|nr:rhodanese-like domain-containing protein [Listeria rustica]MBA3925936.1 rhodanese-like domain-containing protein [Listeria rustica]
MSFNLISVEELESRSAENIIDVRDTADFDAVHIEGVRNIPLIGLPNFVEELNPNTIYSVICYSGKRSTQACEYLSARGLQCENVVGGMNAWLEKEN